MRRGEGGFGRGLGEDGKGRVFEKDKEKISEWGGKREVGCGGNLGGEDKGGEGGVAEGQKWPGYPDVWPLNNPDLKEVEFSGLAKLKDYKCKVPQPHGVPGGHHHGPEDPLGPHHHNQGLSRVQGHDQSCHCCQSIFIVFLVCIPMYLISCQIS